jgi:D-alanyl-D-alanine carboxypeptidase/D-alanyl-D-alanine-endopeptidase (penicillin-binding protein 4)
VVVLDGSGLHGGDRVTCNLLVALLDQRGLDSDLGQGLPVAGQSGTLRERFLSTSVINRLHAKTGFLAESTALSGFVESQQGVDLTFAYVANGDIDDDVVALQDKLAQALVRYPEGASLQNVGPVPLPSTEPAPAPAPTPASPAAPGGPTSSSGG